MPRRRMIDPFFYNDRKVGTSSLVERNLILGCVSQADDVGRLTGDPESLKAGIFKYDNDVDIRIVKQVRDDLIRKMDSWPRDHPYLMVMYQNSGDDYIYFPNWTLTNRPSHPTKSQLPQPPDGITPTSSDTPEQDTTITGETPSQVSLGQSSLGKVSLGKVSAVQEDFTKFLDSEERLTDFLTRTLEEYMPRGPTWTAELLKEFWQQMIGQPMDANVFSITYDAVKRYPAPVLARAYVKAVKYGGGNKKPSKYLQKILEEKAGDPNPPAKERADDS